MPRAARESGDAPKWRRRAEARPDEILDAALEEFSAKGFETARLDDIAAKAGLSKGAVYLYFDSKEAILNALIERQVAPIARMMRGLAEAGLATPESTLSALLVAFHTVLREPQIAAVPKIVFSVAPRFPGVAAFYREQVIEEGLAAIAALHRAGVEKGVFRPADSMTVARFVLGPVLMQVLLRHVFRAPPPNATPEDEGAALADLLMRGIAVEGRG
jgi:AcrR family transcriptional regulator